MSLDQKLKYLRTINHMTQENVAMLINVARSTIAGYETKNRQPSHETLAAIAQLFDVTIDYLINETDTIEFTSNNFSQFHKDEINLLVLYRSLSECSKRELLNHGHLLELRDRENKCI